MGAEIGENHSQNFSGDNNQRHINTPSSHSCLANSDGSRTCGNGVGFHPLPVGSQTRHSKSLDQLLRTPTGETTASQHPGHHLSMLPLCQSQLGSNNR